MIEEAPRGDARKSGARYSILRVSERIPPLPGGKEVHVSELTRAQVAAGHRVRVLYAKGDGSKLDSSAEQIMVPGLLRGRQGLACTAAFASAAARSANRLPCVDLIHVHGDLTEAWWLGRRARKLSAPLVLTLHGGLNPRYRRPSARVFRGVSAFIAIGNSVRDDLLCCGVPESKISVMSSGLDFQLLARTAGVVREPGLIVSVGSLSPLKNVETIIAAVIALPSHFRIRLEIIGDGAQLPQLTALAGGSERVRFLGQMSRPDLYRRVAAADVFVMASKRLREKGEGVPTALLEAMALGRTCIVSQNATPEAVVADAESYLTFDPSDPAALSELLSSVMSGERRRFDEARVAAAVEHLGWPQVARRVDAVYDGAIAAGWTRP